MFSGGKMKEDKEKQLDWLAELGVWGTNEVDWGWSRLVACESPRDCLELDPTVLL